MERQQTRAQHGMDVSTCLGYRSRRLSLASVPSSVHCDMGRLQHVFMGMVEYGTQPSILLSSGRAQTALGASHLLGGPQRLRPTTPSQHAQTAWQSPRVLFLQGFFAAQIARVPHLAAPRVRRRCIFRVSWPRLCACHPHAAADSCGARGRGRQWGERAGGRRRRCPGLDCGGGLCERESLGP